MYAVTVTFRIRADQAEAFFDLICENAARSRADEPGCRQFDVCRNPGTPEVVYLYELYDDRAAFDTHLQAPHFKAFDAASADMIADKNIVTFDEVVQ